MSEQAKILIVDDEEVIHALFRKMFASSNYSMSFATSGEEGLEMFRQIKPDVVLLDYRMLGATGDEFMSELDDVLLSRTSIIMISGHAVPEIDLSERNRRKLFAYFEKPFFEITKLKQTIVDAIERNRR